MPSSKFQVEPTPTIEEELRRSSTSFDTLVQEAVNYLEDGDAAVDDMAVARMYIERGYSEELAYWLVREAEVRRAPR